MKIRVLSDLHLELHPLSNLNFNNQADVVILAGDIGNPFESSYVHLLRKLSLTHAQVIVITGNHEYYNHTIEEVEVRMRKLCSDNIHYLQKDVFIYQDVKFIGCTLWSAIKDESLCKYMNDFTWIKDFTFDQYCKLHEDHKLWLEEELTKPHDKICVITHHLPLIRLTDVEYIDHPLNSFFASDIDVKGADYWCYGHTHKANHIKMGCAFYCNPRGYQDEQSGWDMDCVFKIE